jgi:hypothetical protein
MGGNLQMNYSEGFMIRLEFPLKWVHWFLITNTHRQSPPEKQLPHLFAEQLQDRAAFPRKCIDDFRHTVYESQISYHK